MIQKNWTELIKPNKKVDAGGDAKRFGTIIAEPLERGFGLTLGNALRRVLLSSLQGAAVTAVHIEGVLHEFSSIPGLREDVTDIVLNIKQLGLRMHGEGPKRMTLKATGPLLLLQLRPGDLLCRYAADRFVALLPQADRALPQDLQGALNAHVHPCADGRTRARLSARMAQAPLDPDVDAEVQLLRLLEQLR